MIGSKGIGPAATRRSDLIDLSGKVFGSWTVSDSVQSRVTENGVRTMWLCKCDCGAEHWVNGRQLREGNSTRCKDCQMASLHVEPVCVWCGADTSAHVKKSECPTCDRTRHRNGTWPCGKPVYRYRLNPANPEHVCSKCEPWPVPK